MAGQGVLSQGKELFNEAANVTLYDVLRFLGLARRRIIEKTLADIERDEAAARKRVLDAATRMRDTSGEN